MIDTKTPEEIAYWEREEAASAARKDLKDALLESLKAVEDYISKSMPDAEAGNSVRAMTRAFVEAGSTNAEMRNAALALGRATSNLRIALPLAMNKVYKLMDEAERSIGREERVSKVEQSRQTVFAVVFAAEAIRSADKAAGVAKAFADAERMVEAAAAATLADNAALWARTQAEL